MRESQLSGVDPSARRNKRCDSLKFTQKVHDY